MLFLLFTQFISQIYKAINKPSVMHDTHYNDCQSEHVIVYVKDIM